MSEQIPNGFSREAQQFIEYAVRWGWRIVTKRTHVALIAPRPHARPINLSTTKRSGPLTPMRRRIEKHGIEPKEGES